MADPMLRVQGLTVAYGGIQAVKGLNFHVNQGELVCLIGCNGAGKTSALKALAGLLPFDAQTAVFRQNLNLLEMQAHQRLPNGMALVPEGRGVFTRMSVLENLELGAYCRRADAQGKADIQADLERMLLAFPRLKERLKQSAGTLSGGEQQMLAMARALMGKPELLLLDEPSMGLAPLLVEKIFEVVQQVHQQGMTILLVEQNAHIALQIANRAYVMDSGLIDYEGQASELINDPRIRETYLGQLPA
ncbi:amino acid/amide ABC transporter ATP-binding protein 2 (HAAT family) [Limnobacter thiooxidans]|uniref:ABC transporter ATP-binding protein n=1 Tax=Limnobacter thiooxidans TaxID=131080 RepID=A0AA86J7I4_9BURK|nr:amino acid/amide ABC transporter ATP-binding protein 2 (HAAT family) [Limnobacter thiooxidans]BET26435.1 ABC transporter ATP-binding protein [Limnobacter thiooxidans]